MKKSVGHCVNGDVAQSDAVAQFIQDPNPDNADAVLLSSEILAQQEIELIEDTAGELCWQVTLKHCDLGCTARLLVGSRQPPQGHFASTARVGFSLSGGAGLHMMPMLSMSKDATPHLRQLGQA